MTTESRLSVGIVGAGMIGRTLAWQLMLRGHKITLFDQGQISPLSNVSAAYTAAGMLSPLSEADAVEPEIVELGLQSLALWPSYVAQLDHDVDFQQRGSFILAHPQDQSELRKYHHHLNTYSHLAQQMENVDRCFLDTHAPALSERFDHATYIHNEAWISPQAWLNALAEILSDAGAMLVSHAKVHSIKSHSLVHDNTRYSFDSIIDCRGLGAKPDLAQLRGVRGELMWLHAPEVKLRHLVRLMHPRYRLYLVPRQEDIYLVGATQIESDNCQAITVRSTLELLSAAYSIHSGFGEARVLQSRVNCRPALPDNMPLLSYKQNVMRINGLFRHGVLLAPLITELAIAALENSASPYRHCYAFIQRGTYNFHVNSEPA